MHKSLDVTSMCGNVVLFLHYLDKIMNPDGTLLPFMGELNWNYWDRWFYSVLVPNALLKRRNMLVTSVISAQMANMNYSTTLPARWLGTQVSLDF